MERRAKTAQLIMAIFIMVVLTVACGMYFCMYHKDKQDRRMEKQVEAQVAQYFRLSQNDPNDGRNKHQPRESRVNMLSNNLPRESLDYR